MMNPRSNCKQDPVSRKPVDSAELRILVKPDSAVFGRSWENESTDHLHAIKADHKGIVKFRDTDAEEFDQVRSVLREFCATAPDVISRRHMARGTRHGPDATSDRAAAEPKGVLAIEDASESDRIYMF